MKKQVFKDEHYIYTHIKATKFSNEIHVTKLDDKF